MRRASLVEFSDTTGTMHVPHPWHPHLHHTARLPLTNPKSLLQDDGLARDHFQISDCPCYRLMEFCTVTIGPGDTK